ncbi:MAG: hypothetical protein PHC64_04885 [Candidatus Gastranaerophilales bacterium]|nr:hypothetical protein [Candidatus Gastranaerophilales bacterium]
MLNYSYNNMYNEPENKEYNPPGKDPMSLLSEFKSLKNNLNDYFSLPQRQLDNFRKLQALREKLLAGQ